MAKLPQGDWCTAKCKIVQQGSSIMVFNICAFVVLRPVARSHDGLTLWLVRWLLFRLMFASGIVKLTSQCPTWWKLTALNYHYESQVLD